MITSLISKSEKENVRSLKGYFSLFSIPLQDHDEYNPNGAIFAHDNF